MSVDKNLFLYDLAFVSIMKCEGPYVKEWLDWHLLVGVDHFFIYDNESPDNQREVLQPYIDAGLVTYTLFPGTSPQFPAYNDALKRFRFLCRYMAFIDGDEFVCPQNGKKIAEVVDEILSGKPYAAGLALNWHFFGAGGQREADYSRGVMERFLYRAPTDFEGAVKNVVNPRKISYLDDPHRMTYYEGFVTINEDGVIMTSGSNKPATDKKMFIHHYVTKSYEEYMKKNQRGDGIYTVEVRNDEKFNAMDEASTIFDDFILHDRAERLGRIGILTGGGRRRQPSRKICAA